MHILDVFREQYSPIYLINKPIKNSNMVHNTITHWQNTFWISFRCVCGQIYFAWLYFDLNIFQNFNFATILLISFIFYLHTGLMSSFFLLSPCLATAAVHAWVPRVCVLPELDSCLVMCSCLAWFFNPCLFQAIPPVLSSFDVSCM